MKPTVYSQLASRYKSNINGNFISGTIGPTFISYTNATGAILCLSYREKDIRAVQKASLLGYCNIAAVFVLLDHLVYMGCSYIIYRKKYNSTYDSNNFNISCSRVISRIMYSQEVIIVK